MRAVFGCLLACILLSGCAVLDRLSALSKHEPVPKQEPPPPPRKSPPAPKQLPRVTLLLSDDVPAYTGIADELARQLPESPVIINLQGVAPSGTELAGKLERSGNRPVVAIGQLAARAASRYTGGPVVFCQVFNYLDLGLTATHVQGVRMLPPAELQFRAWKKLDPGLQRVGVITGHGHERLITEAGKAAQRYGIDLDHRVVRSDKGMLYAFKRLVPDIQGLWLLPDDRVLSRRVLRDVMAYSVKHERDVVVFHPDLLQLGALMSVSSVDSDVAEQVIAALRGASNRNKSSAMTLLPLKKIRVEINSGLAQEPVHQSPPASRVAADAP
jgi:ABC-type uncharacterized transport system substrate-binding protein